MPALRSSGGSSRESPGTRLSGHAGGTRAISINGKKVGVGKLVRTIPFIDGVETADVGIDLYSPVTAAYTKGENKFTGKIKKVTVAVK